MVGVISWLSQISSQLSYLWALIEEMALCLMVFVYLFPRLFCPPPNVLI